MAIESLVYAFAKDLCYETKCLLKVMHITSDVTIVFDLSE